MPSAPQTIVQALREKVRAEALNRPGVYRMIADNGVVIYVGKSKRIRTRLLGYFRARREEKAWRIVREARGLEWDYEPSEFASLIRELELIKRHRPPYNVHQKRDGNFSFLKLTTGPAPKLQTVRRVTDEPGTYYGPFRGGERIAEAIRELNDILRLRDCRANTEIRYADQRDLFAVEPVPKCARYELQRCLGPCAGLCTEREYAHQVEQAGSFLRGDVDDPIRQLEARMADAAERWEFEHAASIRDRISRLEMLRLEFQRLRESFDKLTFLYSVPGFEGQHRVYAIRSGSIREVYSAPRSARQKRRLLERAESHFSEPERPSEITSRRRVEQVLLVAHWFRTHAGEYERAYPPERWGELPLAGRLNREVA